MTRLRREAATIDEIDGWATRLEQHLAELELLMGMALPESLEPAFVTPAGSMPLPPAPSQSPGGHPPAPEAPSAPGRLTGAPSHTGGGYPPARDAASGGGSPALPTLCATLRAVREGQRSPSDLVDEALSRIRAMAPLHAFIAVFEEAARREAEQAERRIASGRARLLEGVPVAVKDLVAMAGYAMTGGSRALEAREATSDAPAVARLRRAGAIVVGAANLHELAYGVTSENPHYGAVRNPRDPERVAGGSSGGSAAAVATGMALAALGTDTGGSIRIPAAACGVAGLKPTYGRVSREGVFPLAWSLDHVGPLAPGVADLAVLLALLADEPARLEHDFARALLSGEGEDLEALDLPPALRAAARLAQAADGPALPASAERAAAGLRFGVPPDDWAQPLQPAVSAAWQRAKEALRGAGLPLYEVILPPLAHVRVAQFVILQSEAAAVHRHRLRSRWQDYGADVRLRLKIGEFLSAIDYLQGQRLRRQLTDQARSALAQADVLLLPTLPLTAPPIGTRWVTIQSETEPTHRALTRFTSLFNLTGLPALSLPAGSDDGGLPVGLQLAASWGRELDLLRAGVVLEALLGATG
ncbi:amidase [Carboxydochorda subterranea]|uniref:Amidase n=1 Tax=Carboxydichorda subterranea TaxID=3109565 RepID=A0ABZ1BX64_9FIRM|nr:amidase [Limnochorda sp. L945t]WRP17256.1 amidase [Limnochorda sp. L945t]